MNSRIQVGIRLRPFLDSEIEKGYVNSSVNVGKQEGKISVKSTHGGGQGHRIFEFDHIFDQGSTQEDIYRDCSISELVGRVLEGFHSTIFAYGQTGSGKTYTMEGKHDGDSYVSGEMKGIVARAVEDLFVRIARLKAHNGKTYNVTCSFLQIYNEKIFDLLSNTSHFAKDSVSGNSNQLLQGLKLRWNAREQFQVENLFVFDVKNSREIQQYFLQGVKNRITASHKLNMTSSRSHTIFTISVHTFTGEGAHETSSKLQLVDLAGSERTALTGTEGKMAKESIDINKSLFTLRQVITALSEINQSKSSQPQSGIYQASADVNPSHTPVSSSTQVTLTTQTYNGDNQKTQHIPYRESKLTSLLKQSIGGNCYCLMIACIVPNDLFVEENVSTLHYASRATYIRNQPVKNEDPNKQMLSEMNKENSHLRAELDKANAHIDFLTTALEKSENNNALLKQQNNSLMKQLKLNGCEAEQLQIKGIHPLPPRPPSSQNTQDMTKEQMMMIQQHESYKAQQQVPEFLQKSLEDKMKRRQPQWPKQNDQEGANSEQTNFVQAHQFEAVRQNSALLSMKQLNKADPASNSKQPSSASHLSQHTEKFYTQVDYDNFSDRLIESITLVRKLLESNKDLRQQTDDSKGRVRQCELELIDLTKENQDFREEVQMLRRKYCSPESFEEVGEEDDKVFGCIENDENPEKVSPEKNKSRESVSVRNKKKQSSQSNYQDSQDKDGRESAMQKGDSVIARPQGRLLNKTDYRNLSKNELVKEIFDLQHNMKLLEQRIKSFDSDKNIEKQSHLPSVSVGMLNELNPTSTFPSQKQNNVPYNSSRQRVFSQQNQPSQTLPSSRPNQDDPQSFLNMTSQNAKKQFKGKGGQVNSVPNEPFPTQPYAPIGNSLDTAHSSGSSFLKSSRQSTDSVPTNFGRYTFYQQNFHNLEKLHQQQMGKFNPSPGIQGIQGTSTTQVSIQSSGLPDSSSRKPIRTIGVHSANTSQGGEPSLLNEVNANHIKRGTTAAQFKAQRSNSMNKQPTQQSSTPRNHKHSDELPLSFYQGKNMPSYGVQYGNSGVALDILTKHHFSSLDHTSNQNDENNNKMSVEKVKSKIVNRKQSQTYN